MLTAPPSVDLWNLFNSIWLHNCYVDVEELNPQGTVLDVGANVGVFALLAATRSARVIAFEPSPEIAQYLASNVSKSNLLNVETVQAAISNVTGYCSLFIGDAPTASRVLAHSLAEGQPSVVAVPCFTLAEVMDSFDVDEIDLLKLDCEGSEFDIIAGTDGAVLRRVRRIVAELHPDVAGRHEDEIVGRLQAAGFDCKLTPVAPGFPLLHASRIGLS